ncbi:unnamed protein product, partial [Rotaria socialis]
ISYSKAYSTLSFKKLSILNKIRSEELMLRCYCFFRTSFFI